MFWLIIIIFVVGTIAVYVAMLSRHKKSGSGPLTVTGRAGVVEDALSPNGVVIVDGETWGAYSNDGSTIGKREWVIVMGTDGHRLVVRRREVGGPPL